MKTHFFKTCTIIGICLLFSANSSAQTKEETIIWLKEKLEKYMDNGRSDMNFRINSINIDACSIEIKYTIFTDQKRRLLMPTNVVYIDAKGYFRYSSKVVEDENMILNITDYYSYCTLIINEREPDIKVRVLKALEHLATFCPKKNETF